MTNKAKMQSLIKSNKVILRLTDNTSTLSLQRLHQVQAYRRNIDAIKKYVGLPAINFIDLDERHLRTPNAKLHLWWLGFNGSLCGSLRPKNLNNLTELYGRIPNPDACTLKIFGKKTHSSFNANHNNKAALVDIDSILAEVFNLRTIVQTNTNIQHEWLLATHQLKKHAEARIQVAPIKNPDSYQDAVRLGFSIAAQILSIYKAELKTRVAMMESASSFCEEQIQQYNDKLRQIAKEQITNDLNIISNLSH